MFASLPIQLCVPKVLSKNFTRRNVLTPDEITAVTREKIFCNCVETSLKDGNGKIT